MTSFLMASARLSAFPSSTGFGSGTVATPLSYQMLPGAADNYGDNGAQ